MGTIDLSVNIISDFALRMSTFVCLFYKFETKEVVKDLLFFQKRSVKSIYKCTFSVNIPRRPSSFKQHMNLSNFKVYQSCCYTLVSSTRTALGRRTLWPSYRCLVMWLYPWGTILQKTHVPGTNFLLLH